MKLVTVLPLVFFLGCAASNEATSDDDESASELSAACTIGKDCGDLKLLKARSYSTSRPPAVHRSDVSAELAASSELRVFSRLTSRPLTFDGTKKVTLSGDAAGSAAVRIDDFLLIEVLSPSGALLAAGAVNNASVRVGGQAATLLAPVPAYGGAGQGWVYGARSVDVTPLLPKNTPFRLRVSAFDAEAEALTTDVFLSTEDATVTPPPPPPPPPANDDPFDPASCTGAPATTADFAARFAPGATLAYLGNYSVKVRTRDCNTVSGCTAWRDNPDAFDMSLNKGDRPAPNADPTYGALMIRIASGKILPSFENATCWGNSVIDHQCKAYDAETPSNTGQILYTTHFGWSCFQYSGSPDGQFTCGGYSYTPGLRYQSAHGYQPIHRTLRGWKYNPNIQDSSANMPYARAFFGKSCARVSAYLSSNPGHANADHSEVEVATLVRY
ncbi:MAG: hypothetical protein U0235_02115 [Polyangiaceae bacterium]